jgi:hypothetical protein
LFWKNSSLRIQQLHPESDKFLGPAVVELLNHYQQFFTSQCFDDLTREKKRLLAAFNTMDTHATTLTKQVGQPKSLPDLLVLVSKTPALYPTIITLLRIALTLSATSASCERSFSTMKLIKTYLRNAISNENLTSNAIMSAYKSDVRALPMQDIIDEARKRLAFRKLARSCRM